MRVLLTLCLLLAPLAAPALTPPEVLGLLRTVDDRQRNFGDYKARKQTQRHHGGLELDSDECRTRGFHPRTAPFR